MNENELKEKLGEEAYKVLREKGTEAPFSGEYYLETKPGMYTCKVCNSVLFDSGSKYHSPIPGLDGWPSFDEALPDSIEYVLDNSFGMERTEVVCKNCKSHLGHIFDDETSKTGKHFCVNSICLNLEEK